MAMTASLAVMAGDTARKQRAREQAASAGWRARRRGEPLGRAGKDVVGRRHHAPGNCNPGAQAQVGGNDGFTGCHRCSQDALTQTTTRAPCPIRAAQPDSASHRRGVPTVRCELISSTVRPTPRA